MTHDPMCNEYGYADNVCVCDLIARVRADERERAAERVKALLSFPALPYGRHRIDKAAAIAAALAERVVVGEREQIAKDADHARIVAEIRTAVQEWIESEEWSTAHLWSALDAIAGGTT